MMRICARLAVVWVIHSLTVVSVANPRGRSADAAEVLRILGVPSEGRVLLRELAQRQPGLAEKAIAFRDKPGISVLDERSLNTVASVVIQGIEPLLVEDLYLGHANLRRPPKSTYRAVVLGPLGNMDVVPAICHQLLRSAREPGRDRESARRFTRAALALGMADRGLDAVAFCNDLVVSNDFQSLTGLEKDDAARVRAIIRRWAPDPGAYHDAWHRLFNQAYDPLVNTPENQPLPKDLLNRFVVEFRQVWDMDRYRPDMRLQALGNFADMVTLSKLHNDPTALRMLREAADELKSSTTCENQHRWIEQAMESRGNRPRPRHYGSLPPLETLKPREP